MCLRPPQHGNVQSLATGLKVQMAHSVHISYERSISGRLEPGSSQDRLAYTLHDMEGQMMMALIPSGRGSGGSWIRWAASVYGRHLPALRHVAEKILRQRYEGYNVQFKWMEDQLDMAERKPFMIRTWSLERLKSIRMVAGLRRQQPQQRPSERST